ncbi:Holliday junction resolvase RuvX [Mycobacterium sp.]|uniref:Holliday junction resolvase RuvX n=1 Tax=Mycobacterium sp. TaxID=1785 RepID=UPI0031CFC20C
MDRVGNRAPDRPGGDDPGRGRRLGIDVGSVRIGVACSDPDGILATPVETVLRDRSGKQLRRSQGRRSRAQRVGAGELRRLAELVAEAEAVEVVVGLPRTLSDRTGPSARDAIELADTLARRIAPIPVRLADERLTTVAAQRSLRAAGVRAKGQRAIIDQAAAVAILQGWLDQCRAARPEEVTGG